MKDNEKKRFIPVEGKLIEVTEEVYKAYYRDIWRTRYHARKNGECGCPKKQVWKCDGICPGCQYYTAGKKVSIDTPIGDDDSSITLGDTLVDDNANTEDLVMDMLLLKVLWEELEKLDPEGKRMCELMMEHSERETADIMGIPRSTFKRRWNKVKEELKENLKDYYY